MHTTNVKPSELNYGKYSAGKYDLDIVNSIPYHKEIHGLISSYIFKNYQKDAKYSVLDLGAGTGITSRVIKDQLSNADFDLVDFSSQMLKGAKAKMGSKNAKYILGDYSQLKFTKKYDLAVSVIGLHHQSHFGKRRMFKKIYKLLKPGGVFIFADLVTYRNQKQAALNQARHFQHLAENASDEKTLGEWAYHHLYLNNLAPVEDQIQWLKVCGFSVKQEFLKFNTVLLVCRRRK